jgi:hypothetical protein
MLTNDDLKNIDGLMVKRVQPLAQDVVKIRKDMKTVVNFFDHEYLDLRKRIQRLEDHLGLPTIS